MSRMNSAWKIVQPKAKPSTYSSTTSLRPAIPKHASEHRSGDDADAVAGDAMHRRSEHLPPARGDILLMEPGQRLAAAQHVEKRPDHAGVGGEQDEPPFEDGRFWRAADVDRHENERDCGLREPQEHDAVQRRPIRSSSHAIPRYRRFHEGLSGHNAGLLKSRDAGTRVSALRRRRPPGIANPHSPL